MQNKLSMDQYRDLAEKFREATQIVSHMQFPNHITGLDIEREWTVNCAAIIQQLGWMDDRLTEAIIYAND